jgi:hypothetical protein
MAIDHDGRNGDDMDKPQRPNPRFPRPPIPSHEGPLKLTVEEALKNYATFAAGYYDFTENKLPQFVEELDTTSGIALKAIGVAEATRNEVISLRRTLRDGFEKMSKRQDELRDMVPGTIPPRSISSHDLAKEIAEELKTSPGFPVPGAPHVPKDAKTDSERVREGIARSKDAEDAEKWRRQVSMMWKAIGALMAAVLIAGAAMAFRVAAAVQQAEEAHARGVAEGKAAVLSAPPESIATAAPALPPPPPPSASAAPRRR